MQCKPLPTGVDNFEKLITRGYYFVDKTLLIKELLDKKGDVNLFTRPRRFGKTLNMSMVQYFFEDARKDDGTKMDNRSLFDGLSIMESGHRFILQGNLLEIDKIRYQNIMEECAKEEDYNDSLKFLSQCMEQYYGHKAIILIDEYDVPLENAFFAGFYEEMTAFIRSLFESALKTNSSLEFAVITGCLRISKESIFTGMNNMKINSILNKSYDEFFGFTEVEVMRLCDDYHLTHKFPLIKEWYNGYVFGNVNVYNPWSVISFIGDLQVDENELPASYWANTSSNSIVRTLIEMADDETRSEIEQLIAGKSIEKPVHEDITYDEIYKTMDNLWNFMFFTGYFRRVGERMDVETKQRYVELKIPNEEVKYIFRNKVLGWFQETINRKDLSVLYHALIRQDPATLEQELTELLMKTISFNDAYESFYHGFIAGVLSGMNGYTVKSNREGGRGRSDLYIKPVTRKKPAYVIEFKIAGKFSEMEAKAEDALEQIEDRNYCQELFDDGYGTVICYGISFFGKDCLVKMKE